MTLNKFNASYIASGQQRGQPNAFDAQVSYTEHRAARSDRQREVNRPLSIDGTKVYLIGHGYAPVFKVTDARGVVVYDQATPFISGATGNFLSQGVVKVPDAQPEQLGFTGVFVPTAVDVGGTLQSAFPAGGQSGGEPHRLRREPGREQRPLAVRVLLDTGAMQRLTATPQVLAARPVAESCRTARASITFTGYVPWVSLTITHDPGQLPALICGIAALAGLVLSFMVRRAAGLRPGPRRRHGTTVQVGGLTRTDASGSFEDEFAQLAAELRSAHEQAASAPAATGPLVPPAAAADHQHEEE